MQAAAVEEVRILAQLAVQAAVARVDQAHLD
jgi:hypothetical protein